MIRVERDAATFPMSLSSSRAAEARRAVEQVLVMDARARAQRRIPFDAEVYADKEVRASLNTIFAGRCAFCESTLGTEWSVHHFRPLRAASDRTVSKIAEAHYAWFAYEWGNLYPACPACNRSKRSLFPVRGRRAAPFTTLDEAREAENALLVDPGLDYPAQHLTFAWDGLCEALSGRGIETIEVFNLNRTELVYERYEFASRLLNALSNPNLRPSDVLEAVEIVEQERPGAANALLHRFVDDLADRTGRTTASRNPVHALREFLKDLEPDSYHTSLLEAREAARLSRRPSETVVIKTAEPIPVDATPVLRSRGVPGEVYLPARDLQLRSVTVESFKALHSLRFALSERRQSTYGAPSLMLLGENATGKSSILEAIALTLIGTAAAARVVGPPSRFLRRKDPNRWALMDAEATWVAIDFFGSGTRAELQIDPARKIFEGTEHPTALVLGYGPRRYFDKARKGRRGGAEKRVRTLFDPLATIPHPVPWLASLQPSGFYEAARALREVLALHVEDDLIRDDDLGIAVRVNGMLTPLERMSEGYKALLAMTVDIVRELMAHWRNLEDARAVVLIDEIETHLHPRWKMRVMPALRRAFPNVTFIATTHDPLCLRGLDDGEVAVLVRDERQNIDRLRELPSIKGLRAEQLLTSDYFGLSSTADPETEASISHYADLLTTRDLRSDDEAIAELSQVEAQLSRTLVLGDTAVEQVVAQAMSEFLNTRRKGPPAERTEARRRAVSAVLDTLNRAPKG